MISLRARPANIVAYAHSPSHSSFVSSSNEQQVPSSLAQLVCEDSENFGFGNAHVQQPPDQWLRLRPFLWKKAKARLVFAIDVRVSMKSGILCELLDLKVHNLRLPFTIKRSYGKKQKHVHKIRH